MTYLDGARITLNDDYTVSEFLTWVGASPRNGYYYAGTLYIIGKNQTEVNAAAVTFNPGAARVAAKWAEVREIRDAILRKTDYTQVLDYPGTDKAATALYRQRLRDIPQAQTDPYNIVWPVNGAL